MNRRFDLPAVSLVSLTPDAEKTIAYCARVSNPANQANENIAGLLSYCARKQHWSIFEMATMVLEITTTRTIARQILRHRSFSFQEFSQRYGEVEAFAFAECRRQDTKNRQNSIDDLDEEIGNWWESAQASAIAHCVSVYQKALEAGVAKECARAVLPEGMAITRMYMQGTIRSWLTYLQTRLGNGTQLEHQLVARQVLAIMTRELPVVMEAFGYFRDVDTRTAAEAATS